MRTTSVLRMAMGTGALLLGFTFVPVAAASAHHLRSSRVQVARPD